MANPHCVWCQSSRVRKNGHHQDGKQNYQCLDCSRQFVEKAHHISEEQKNLVRTLLLERISLRGICRVAKVSLSWLLWFMKKECSKVLEPSLDPIATKQKDNEIPLWEVDEMWSYIGTKKEPIWLWLIMDKKTRKILGYHVGKRDKENMQNLWEKIPDSLKKKL